MQRRYAIEKMTQSFILSVLVTIFGVLPALAEHAAEEQQNGPEKNEATAHDGAVAEQSSDGEKKPIEIKIAPARDMNAIRAVDFNAGDKVWVIPMEGPIMRNTVFHVRRSLKDAKAANAKAIIIEMNTPGGEVGAVIEIMEDLLRFRPLENTYTFINPDAYSGGAFVSAATRHIVMSPSGVIGAARIIAGGGQEIAERVEEKFRSAVKAKLRSACEIQGHRVDIFQAMVGDEPEIKIGDVVINPENAVLTLTAKEAVRVLGDPPAPLLAKAITSDLDELMRMAGMEGAEVVRSEPTGFETIAGWIVMIAPVLLLMGIVGIYVELRTPGFGLPGIAGLLCFALFFFGHNIAGLSGQETTLLLAGLFLLGLVLIAVEIFFAPGAVVFALLGIVCVVIALVLTMADYWPSESPLPTPQDIGPAIVNLLIAVVGAFVVSLAAVRLLPEVPPLRKAIVGSAPPPSATRPDYTGREGVALCDLRPGGQVRIGQDVVEATTEGDYVLRGQRVRVVSSRGLAVLVEKV